MPEQNEETSATESVDQPTEESPGLPPRPTVVARLRSRTKDIPSWAAITIPIVLVAGLLGGGALALFTPAATVSPAYSTLHHSLSAKNSKLLEAAKQDSDSIASDEAKISSLQADAQAVADKATELDNRESAVKAREDAVTTVEHTIAANTFAGDGTYIVNTDIQPGRYRSVGGSDCYWARQDASGGIIDNDIASGSAVVTVQPGDSTLKVSRCAPFTKVG